VALAALLATACEGEPEPKILIRWTHELASKAAPAGIGPERRVIVAVSEMVPDGGGHLAVIDEQIGTPLEGPFDNAQLTDHRPVLHENKIFVITKIGKLHAVDLGGTPVFTAPTGPPLGQTTPLAVAPDGSLRFATVAGDVYGFSTDGTQLFKTAVGGAVTSALAVDEAGVAYAATDTGRLIGVDGTGGIAFDVQIGGQVHGPSVRGDLITVGDLDGVLGFGKDGVPRFDKPRAARIAGTAILPSQEILAWGDDGIVQLLDANGDQIMRYRSRPDGEANPPRIATEPKALAGDRFAVIDESGRAHLIDRDGRALVTVELGADPSPEITVASVGYVLVAVGNTIKAVDFAGQ